MIRISYTTIALLGIYGDIDAAVAQTEWLSLTKHIDPPHVTLMGWWDSKSNVIGVGLQLDLNDSLST
jgi:hypothetical protein